jgi:hypothetical protein
MTSMISSAARRAVLAGLSVLAVLTLSAAPALAASAEEALAFVNQQRAANGIPPVPLDQSLLRPECSLENHHIASPDVAAWSATTSPWDYAPLHQSILYDPNATAAAYGEFGEFKSNNPTFPSSVGQWACMWFTWNWEVRNAPVEPAFYAFVGDRGPSSVPAQEVAGEWPGTPAQMVGLPQGATTGPNLLVYALHMGGGSHIVAASLTSAAGTPVEVRSVDSDTSYQGQYWMTGWRGVVIPVSPLQWSTSYTATVAWANTNGYVATQTFSFTTEPQPPPPAPELGEPEQAEGSFSPQRSVRLRITHAVHRGRSLRLTVSASKILSGRHLTATIRYLTRTRRGRLAAGCRHDTRLVLRTKTLRLSVARRDPLVVELRSSAFTAGGRRYAAASTKRRINK